MSQNFLATSELFSKGYGFIPKVVMIDTDLTVEAKAIYGYLASYSGAGMSSYPSTKLMLKHLNMSESRYLKHRSMLIKKGYISIKQQRTETRYSKNIYILNQTPSEMVSENDQSTQNECTQNESAQNECTQNKGINSNSFNNNSINSNSENNLLSGKAEPRIPFKEIIDYLNEKTGSRYKHTSKKTQSLIKARFNDGFTLEDFKKVIDIKTDEWKDTDMSKFLRPETLFGTKFESYLNQKQVTKGGYDGPTRYDELF